MIICMEMSASPVFGAVVAIKPAPQAKTRLGELPTPLRERLARTMAVDTLRALATAGAELIIVGGDPELPGMLRTEGISARWLAEPVPGGMNAALRSGAAMLRSEGHRRVLACVGDLPALTAEAISTLLITVDQQYATDQEQRRSFVPDLSGSGTTILIAIDTDLDPHFQHGSAAAHRASGATAIMLADHRELRADVDTTADLPPVIDLGVGTSTRGLINTDAGRIADYAAVTVTSTRRPDDSYQVITDSGVRADLPVERLDRRIRFLRSGQRLHAAVVGSRLISAWW